ncbi:MAG: response regulator [Magnetococcales bacterium]|nr:response regulator [Magnetococcales bacterium]
MTFILKKRNQIFIILGFTTILLIGLGIQTAHIIHDHRENLTKTYHHHIQSELDLITHMVRDAALMHDLSTVQNFFLYWADSHQDIPIVELVAPNGFILFRNDSIKKPKHIMFHEQKIHQNGRLILTLRVTHDLDQLERDTRNLSWKLAGSSAVLTLILGLSLWYFLTRYSIRPLETEIQHRLSAEKSFRLSEQKFYNLFSTISSGVAIYAATDDGDDFIFKDINKAGEKLSNITQAEVIGRRVTELFPGIGQLGLLDAFKQVWKTGQPLSLPLSQYEDQRITQWVKNDIHRLDNGEIVAVFEDITQLKQQQQELELAKESAEKANHAKGDFLATMSHEIRTPLNVILGLGDVLHETQLSNQQSDYVRRIRAAGNALYTLINDILDFSKIESGQLALTMEPITTHILLEDLSQIFESTITHKGLSWSLTIDESMPKTFQGNATRVGQILINLIGNAFKFTDKGHIQLRVYRSDDTLSFSVHDSGIGIEADMIDQIFDKFTQVESGNTRNYQGTGLGLAISHKLSHLMGGDIIVESHVNKGSIFTLILPYIPVKASQIHTDSSQPALTSHNTTTPLNILIAEDAEDNRLLLHAYLKKTPHIVEMVKDGQEAVARVKQTSFDLILMDIQMPKMNGYQATRAIREWEADNQRQPLPIWALTAHALDDNLQKTLDAGCNGHITKPIRKDDLLAFLDRCSPYLTAENTRPVDGGK